MKRVVLGGLIAIVSLAIMVSARIAFVERSGFDAEDLRRFESGAYGVDLPDWYEEQPFFLAWSRGDGQVFVTLGVDPLAQGPAQFLGWPLYRYGRVGYSLLGRLAVGWNADLVPVGLWLVNSIAVLVLGWIAGTRLSDLGPRSLLIPLNPAVLVGYTADTAEVVAIAAVTLALAARRTWVVAALGAILGTTRESYLTAGLAARRGILVGVAAAGAAVLVRLFGLGPLGLPWTGTGGNLTLPFVGYVQAWGHQDPVSRAVGLGVLAVALMTLYAGLKTRRGLERVAFVSTGLLVICLADVVLDLARNSLRAAGGLGVLWTSLPAAEDLAHEGVDPIRQGSQAPAVVDDDVR